MYQGSRRKTTDLLVIVARWYVCDGVEEAGNPECDFRVRQVTMAEEFMAISPIPHNAGFELRW